MGRFVVKLGSTIVAQDDGALRADVLEHICDEIAERHAAGDDVVIVTSGAIARGVQIMGLGGRPSAMADLQAASAVGQGKLYRVYDELLRERGVTSAQVLLTFFDVGHRAHYLNARQTLRRLLDWRVVPVINENDTTATDEISFGDNDFLAAQVAILVGADRLVLLTNQDGLHTADPRTDPGAPLVARGRRRRASSTRCRSARARRRSAPAGCARRSSRPRWRPRPASRRRSAAACATACWPGARRARRSGTRFAPQEQRHSSFELWLKYAKPAHGTIVVDAGAARALRDGGASLLPVGIVEVTGDFEEGDAVEVRSADGGHRQGDRELRRRATCGGSRDASPRRCARCFRARPTRPSTATTSSWPERGDRGRACSRAPPTCRRPARSATSASRPIVASPLLIPSRPRPRRSGRAAHHARACASTRPSFALLVEGSGRAPSLTAYGSATACAHAFNDALGRAARDGLGAVSGGDADQRRAPGRAGGRPARLTTLWVMATTAQSVSDICLAARDRRAHARRDGQRHAGARAARDRRRARSRGRTRSSRPTRATWRPAARPG